MLRVDHQTATQDIDGNPVTWEWTTFMRCRWWNALIQQHEEDTMARPNATLERKELTKLHCVSNGVAHPILHTPTRDEKERQPWCKD